MESGCTICRDAVYNSDSYFETQCHHNFHCSCLEQWLTQSCVCPECESEITKEGLTKYSRLSFHDESGNEVEISLDELEKKLPELNLKSNEQEKKFIVLKGLNSESEMQKLKKELEEKTLITMEQERRILELKTLNAKREMEALCLNRLLKLQIEQDALKKENQIRASINQKLLQENKALKSKVEYLRNMKLILERRPKDIEDILKDMPIHTFSEEEKLAIGRLASYYTKLQKDLCSSEEKRTQLQKELTKEKCKLAAKVKSKRNNRIRRRGTR